jgi:hypothetical protein
MKHPSPYPLDAYRELESAVSGGHYQRYDQLSALPSGLSRIAGFPTRNSFRTAVVLASNSSENPPTIGSLAPASSAPVFRISTVRADRHGSTGEPHINKDDVLVFQDRSGKPWQLYAHHQPGHYTSLSTDAGLDLVLDTLKWPREREGTLKSLRAKGALVDFSTGHLRGGAL